MPCLPRRCAPAPTVSVAAGAPGGAMWACGERSEDLEDQNLAIVGPRVQIKVPIVSDPAVKFGGKFSISHLHATLLRGGLGFKSQIVPNGSQRSPLAT